MSTAFSTRALSTTGPAERLVAVMPSDAADLPQGPCRGLHTVGGGALTVVDLSGGTITLFSNPGQYHPVRVTRVLATGTDATGVVALY